jgi:hypothetical protein
LITHVRDLGFIVTDGHAFFSERSGMPARRRRRSPVFRVSIRNTDADGRYRIEELTDPGATSSSNIRFIATQGRWRSINIIWPLDQPGNGNSAWVGE